MTQEQAEAMVSQFQQMDAPALEPIPALIPEDLELKEGLSVTASILIEEALDVVLVPNQAITYRGPEAYVQVVTMLTDETTTFEERLVETGLSDWQYTEVTAGLSEGEQVITSEVSGTGTASTSPEGFQRPQGGMIVPGMGGGPPPQ